VFAQYDGLLGNTLVWAQSEPSTTLSTYAFCFAFKSPVSWTYLEGTYWMGLVGTGGPPTNLLIPTKQNWCYMDGVGTVTDTVDSGLLIKAGSYYSQIGTEDLLIYNCLPLKQ
jgi:hypothetical protein